MAVKEFLIGNSVKLEVKVTSPNGQPDDPTGIKLRVELPRSDILLESPDDLDVQLSTGTGEAWCVFKPTVPGVYAYKWWIEELPSGAAEGIFRVRPSALSNGV